MKHDYFLPFCSFRNTRIPVSYFTSPFLLAHSDHYIQLLLLECLWGMGGKMVEGYWFYKFGVQGTEKLNFYMEKIIIT